MTFHPIITTMATEGALLTIHGNGGHSHDYRHSGPTRHFFFFGTDTPRIREKHNTNICCRIRQWIIELAEHSKSIKGSPGHLWMYKWLCLTLDMSSSHRALKRSSLCWIISSRTPPSISVWASSRIWFLLSSGWRRRTSRPCARGDTSTHTHTTGKFFSFLVA